MTKLTRAAFMAVALSVLSCCGSKAKSATSSTTTAATPTASATATTASATATNTVPAGDVCALVTQQEASTAFGAPSTAPKPAASPLAQGKSCAYFANDTKDSLSVSLLSNASAAQFAAVEASVQLPGETTSSLTGIGDTATLASAGATAVVIFMKGSNVVVVTLNLTGQPTPVNAVGAVASEAAARV